MTSPSMMQWLQHLIAPSSALTQGFCLSVYLSVCLH